MPAGMLQQAPCRAPFRDEAVRSAQVRHVRASNRPARAAGQVCPSLPDASRCSCATPRCVLLPRPLLFPASLPSRPPHHRSFLPPIQSGCMPYERQTEWIDKPTVSMLLRRAAPAIGSRYPASRTSTSRFPAFGSQKGWVMRSHVRPLPAAH